MSPEYNSMKGINNYGDEMSAAELLTKKHRAIVGGMWEKIGKLQFEFLKSQGLQPQDNLLDVGCGSLRGGLHYIEYLSTGHYSGIDINSSLLEAGRLELKEAQLEHKQAQLILNDEFDLGLFNKKFEFMIAVSVFTHLPLNIIIRCLVQVRKNLKENGRFYATVFIVDEPCHIDPVTHELGNIVTHYDHDPFHMSFKEIQVVAELVQLKVKLIGEWNHPRSQQMVEFRLPK